MSKHQRRETESASMIAAKDVWQLTEPHIEGTMKSFVAVQYCINLPCAIDKSVLPLLAI